MERATISTPVGVPPQDEILARLRSIAADRADLAAPTIDLDADFIDDLGMDSLDMVEFQMAAEEAFAIAIPDDKVDSIRTVRAAGDLVRELLAAEAR
jgi:acyl carrier protein